MRLPSVSRYALTTLAFTAVAGAASADDRTIAIEAVFARWAGGDTPGCALGVDSADAPPVIRAWGLAELEHGAAAGPDTIYEAGSVSKQVTAAAMLLLAEEGRLSLDDEVRRYVPELPDYGTPITLRHLLTHTSGLRDWGSVAAMEGWPRGQRAVDNARVVEILSRQRSLNFAPGSEWLYSNSGYNLAAEIVRRVSGESLAAFTKRRIFQPLGMARTGWRDDYTAVVPGRAAAYERKADGYHLAMPFENAHGNGGLLTTVADLLIWNRALDEGALGEAVTRGLHERGVAGGRETHYALGLEVDRRGGEVEISHGGATGGYRAWLARYPDRDLSIAVLCNAAEANAPMLGHQVADLFLSGADPETAFVPETTPEGGLFVSERTGEPFGLRAGPQGLATMAGRPLAPVGPGRYRMGDEELVFTDQGFERISGGWDVIPYRRTEAASPDAAALAALTGTYGSVEARSEVRVELVDGRLALRRGVEPPSFLAPAQADVFTGPAGVVRFERDTAGRVTAFHLNNGRVRDMTFQRAD